MFVDASALVAILTMEPGHELLTLAIGGAVKPITSALAIYETVLAIDRKLPGIAGAQAGVAAFLQTAGIDVMPIGSAESLAAIEAFSRFGKGQGHPAQLNMGDCFAYACARTAGCSLLFKDSDFSRTDIQAAIATL